ncbi:MAG TPA: carbohydrate ABC transporter permease [Thermoflexales bacterium]|jgi:multiple sugar transport system permease protein|nr:carbohydrate ABC transporter permease [Thermoflexales bacterium]HQX10803.1 carbohydrate ABC transporter permease [Thermoflexales bacterium]HQY25894.1 carbohydrate ABC transporter permease [Thermoflexales bacterium]HQZ53801.1 carbohydrate ABC transporter permease [Thermoflexales bacterium]HRA53834.1 carbohydrate ABC transporter permease [Thermoflexales bacterium]
MATRLSLIQKIIAYGSLAALALFILFPVYFMAITSLKTVRDIYRLPSLLPVNPTLINYEQLVGTWKFLDAIRNSLIVASATTLVSVFISALAAYSLVRLRYKFRNWAGRLIMFSYLTPSSLLFIPLAVIVAQLGISNTHQGLIFVYLTFSAPLSTWLLMGYFRGIPVDYDEQAMVDGCTRLGAFFRVVLPLSVPGLIACSVFTFTGAWNELLLSLIFITDPALRTVPVAVSYLITGDTVRMGLIMAASIVSALPIMILYFIAQRFVVQGLGAGGVKA